MKEKPNNAVDYITAILTGDRVLLTRMRQELYPMVRTMVLKSKGDEERAKDIFQEAIMVIYEKAKKPDFVLTSKFSTFFYGVCKYRWLKWRQKKSSSEVTIAHDDLYEIVEDWEPEYGSPKWERGKLYDHAFAQLGEHCQKLLLLFFNKKPMEEIAKELNISNAGNARKQKERCKNKLTELVTNDPRYQDLIE